jgi:hypothetical protein
VIKARQMTRPMDDSFIGYSSRLILTNAELLGRFRCSVGPAETRPPSVGRRRYAGSGRVPIRLSKHRAIGANRSARQRRFCVSSTVLKPSVPSRHSGSLTSVRHRSSVAAAGASIPSLRSAAPTRA